MEVPLTTTRGQSLTWCHERQNTAIHNFETIHYYTVNDEPNTCWEWLLPTTCAVISHVRGLFWNRKWACLSTIPIAHGGGWLDGRLRQRETFETWRSWTKQCSLQQACPLVLWMDVSNKLWMCILVTLGHAVGTMKNAFPHTTLTCLRHHRYPRPSARGPVFPREHRGSSARQPYRVTGWAGPVPAPQSIYSAPRFAICKK